MLPAKKRWLNELKEFLSLASISTDPAYRKEMIKTAQWLSRHLKNIGLSSELIKGSGHPLVYAEKIIDARAPTLLICSHYDVQPVDPIEQWETHPFRANVRKGRIYARGASDSKGQLFAYIKGAEEAIRSGKLGMNVKFIIEGDEEANGKSLAEFLAKNQKKLSADSIIYAGGAMINKDTPAICYGVRGLLALEIEAWAFKDNLHSGSFGGGFANPAEVLAQLLTSVKWKNRQIAIGHFYDGTTEYSDSDLESPYSEKELLKMTDAIKLVGEKRFSTIERISSRPTFEINSFASGYTGEGFQFIIPNRAVAKVSFRLAPGQTPKRAFGQFKKFINMLNPGTVKISIRKVDEAMPALMAKTSLIAIAAAKSLQRVFGRKVAWYRDGGAVPIIHDFQQITANVIMVGFGLLDDNIHAPNEKLDLKNFFRGVEFARDLLMGS
ncbi:MAG: beta-Ala-His dipeptidase [Parcubacteria group bacterium Gr01-1014_3]|nr:MAG: beta-Ala-His dipeptidase [Parcubacteria group bacterium Gr01-1014_3]